MRDVIVVGGGPAGLAASIYCSRYNMDVLVVTKEKGGQINDAHKVCNYPGFAEITGAELAERLVGHAEELGIDINESEAVSIRKKKDSFVVETEEGEEVEARSLILALGKARRKLNIEGEDDFLGKGVSYCATCDGPLFRDRKVAVVGGSNAATTSALLLSQYAEKVYIIYRRDELRGMPVWVSKVEETDNIEVIYETVVTGIKGDDFVTSIALRGPEGETELEVDGIFIEIGGVPRVSLAKEIGIEIDGTNHIIVKPDQSTNVKGVFAAGDMTTGSDRFQQVVTAAAEGAIAGRSAYEFIEGD